MIDSLPSSLPLPGDLPSVLLSLLTLYLSYHLLKALYHISPLHPLSKFPGPRIAAATYGYEAYYDWILVGRYGHRIAEMHKTYGPIVRINPDELHCSDPHFLDEVYPSSPHRIRDKWYHQLNTGGSSGPIMLTAFSTVPHELHRSRRAPFSRFLSRQQMNKLEGEVLEFVHMTIDKLLRFSGKPAFNIKEAFQCFTGDVISQYAFGEAPGFVAKQEGWEPNFGTWTASFVRSAYMMRHNFLARESTRIMPLVADYLGEDVRKVMHQMTVVIPGHVKKAINDPENGRVFGDLMKDRTVDDDPKGEMGMARLTGEGFNLLIAGTETTAAILTVITYHLLASPEIYARLMAQDLGDGVDPANLKWMELEQKPYLWAIVQEALRMMPGVSHRSARIAREEDLHYKSQDGSVEWVIPRGTPIGMTSMMQHWNEEIFPEPSTFKPERWLTEDGKPNLKLQRFSMAFGKGHRVCIGENLALCEIYLMATLLALRLIPRAKLHETTMEDLKYDHDMVVPYTKKGPIAVRVKIE